MQIASLFCLKVQTDDNSKVKVLDAKEVEYSSLAEKAHEQTAAVKVCREVRKPTLLSRGPDVKLSRSVVNALLFNLKFKPKHFCCIFCDGMCSKTDNHYVIIKNLRT